MKVTFRWFGPDDPVTLGEIRQIPGVTGIITSAFDIPADQVVPSERFEELAALCEAEGFTLDAIESIPVHEDIKLGRDNRDELIGVFNESLRNAGKAGIPVVCYNFMLAFDWIRTDLAMKLDDGSTALSYNHKDLETLDLTRELPAWSTTYTPETLEAMLAAARALSEEELWANLQYFLERVVPVAEEAGVLLAIHPDDPPWPVLGIPRIITSEENLDRFLRLVDRHHNGLALCSGSLGANPDNDIPQIARRFSGEGRIHFAHIRNIRFTGEKEFHESAHLSSEGSLDLFEIIKAYHDTGFTGPMRPDHGRNLWGEERKPGYGLFDRAIGAAYLQGLWEGAEKMKKGGK